MEFGKRHDTSDTPPIQFLTLALYKFIYLLTYLHNGLLSAPILVADVLQGNWCNGFRPLLGGCLYTYESGVYKSQHSSHSSATLHGGRVPSITGKSFRQTSSEIWSRQNDMDID